jgi:hypothetical protein
VNGGPTVAGGVFLPRRLVLQEPDEAGNDRRTKRKDPIPECWGQDLTRRAELGNASGSGTAITRAL